MLKEVIHEVTRSLCLLFNPIELEIKDTAGTDRSVSYLELHLEFDSEGRLRSKPYDKRDDLNLPIVKISIYM
jgi:hypothetical protein